MSRSSSRNRILRQALIAFVLAMLGAAGLLLLTSAIDAAWPGHDPLGTLIDKIQSNWPTRLSWLDELTGGKLAAIGKGHAFKFLTAVLLMVLWVKKSWIAHIDLLFFAPFDRKTLEPIRHETGLLRWHLADPEQAGRDEMEPRELQQREAWDQLLAWVRNGAGDGRWKAFWRKPDLPMPFSWAVLAGPNGQGKTQLALELGRHLARRETLGDAGHRLPWGERWQRLRAAWSTWRRLWCWWKPRAAADPWDAGLLPAGHMAHFERLESWRPRRPTLLVVDDPRPGDWRSAIESLQLGSGEFHHPVRLLFVDQCRPADPLPDARALAGRTAEPATLSDSFGGCVVLDGFAFSERNLRAPQPWRVLSGAASAEPPGIPRDLWNTESLRRFYEAVRGEPVLAALGVHWLSVPGRHLALLTETAVEDEERALAGDGARRLEHRLLDARLDELLDSFRGGAAGMGVDLWRAIGCATLAGGLPFDAARRAFGFKQEGPEIDRLFPHFAATRYTLDHLPPIKPAVVGDRFLVRVLPDLVRGKPAPDILAELVRIGWTLEPGGMQRALRRLGGRRDVLGEAMRTLPEPADAAEALDLARAFAEAAIRHGGALDAARGMLDRALALAGARGAADLLPKLDGLAAPLEAAGLPAVVLYGTAAARALEAGGDDALAERVLAWLETHLPRAGWRGTPGEADTRAFHEALRGLLGTAAFRALRDSGEGCRRLHRRVAAALWKIPFSVRAELAAPGFDALAEGAAEADGWPALWAIMADAARWDAAACAARVAAFAADAGPELAARAWRYLASAHAVEMDVENTRAAAGQVEAIAGREPWLDDAAMQRLRAAAWRYLAYALSAGGGDVEAVRETVENVEAIAGRECWRDDRYLQYDRSTAWGYLTYMQSQMGNIEAARETLKRVEAVATQELWMDDRDIQWNIAEAWRNLAFAHSVHKDVDATRQAALRVEAIAGRDLWRDDRDMQKERATAWRCLAFAHSEHKDVDATRQAAERVEAIAGRDLWRDDRDLQGVRAVAWRCLASAHSQHRDVVTTRQAAERVEAIAGRELWRDDLDVQRERAAAWGNLAYAHGLHKDVDATRQAAQRVEAIAGRELWRDDRDVQRERAVAWCWLAFACGLQVDLPGTRRAAARVLRIARHWPADADMQVLAAEARSYVAYVYYRQGYRTQARNYVARVEALCARPEFAADPKFIRIRDDARKWAGEPRPAAGPAPAAWTADFSALRAPAPPPGGATRR